MLFKVLSFALAMTLVAGHNWWPSQYRRNYWRSDHYDVSYSDSSSSVDSRYCATHTAYGVLGAAKLGTVVDAYIAKLLSDRIIAPFFRNSNLAVIGPSFRRYFIQFFGGPKVYTGPSLLAAHNGQRLTNADFDRFVYLLRKVLNSLWVNRAIANCMLDLLNDTRSQVVGV